MSCENCSGCGCLAGDCACACHDSELRTPINRSGQGTLHARLGDYGDFFGNAIARLSDSEGPGKGEHKNGGSRKAGPPALRALGTREQSDPTIAWLDAWASAADVLTFYRERLTNESYLRTATDENALRELAALIGFRPRPGISATAYLAYLLEKNALPVEIPVAARAQSVPAPGEQMQTFETDERFIAHAQWSQMRPRLTRPPSITIVEALLRSTLRLSDTSLVVRPGEQVLFLFGSQPGQQVMREVDYALTDVIGGFVELNLKARPGLLKDQAIELWEMAKTSTDQEVLDIVSSYFLGGGASDCHDRAGDLANKKLRPIFGRILNPLPRVEDLHPKRKASTIANVLSEVGRIPTRQLSSGRLLKRTSAPEPLLSLQAIAPTMTESMTQALTRLEVTSTSLDNSPAVFLIRQSATAFGAFAPVPFEHGTFFPDALTLEPDESQFVFLDAQNDTVLPGSFVIIDRAIAANKTVGIDVRTIESRVRRISMAKSVQAVGRSAYGITGRSTRLELVDLTKDEPVDVYEPLQFGIRSVKPFMILRTAMFFLQSTAVTLAPDVELEDVKGGRIVLEGRIDGLQAGQRCIVSGERTDIKDANNRVVTGVTGTELAIVAAVDLSAGSTAPGDTYHTTITFATPLAYTYLRSSVVIYGNVISTSHGETVSEVLGSGVASRAGQAFQLKRSPLTFAPADTIGGVKSTEEVRVNGIRYAQVDTLLDADESGRAYQLEVDANGSASLFFGDGIHGARLPTGEQNVKVKYRAGLGRQGNVRAGQISLLTTRPLGVTGVINPLPATGGADRDSTERIQRDAPIVTHTLVPQSRIVSVADYAYFARRFAGIGQADAIKLSDGVQEVVHVTVAGIDNIPIEPRGVLIQKLENAFLAFSDPSLAIEVAVRELVALVLQAKVAISPEADWDIVEPEIRRRLLKKFGAEQRRLGQPAYLSEVVATIQSVPNVAWVDIDNFCGISESQLREMAASVTIELLSVVGATRAHVDASWKRYSAKPRIRPAQLAIFLPEVAGHLILNKV